MALLRPSDRFAIGTYDDQTARCSTTECYWGGTEGEASTGRRGCLFNRYRTGRAVSRSMTWYRPE